MDDKKNKRTIKKLVIQIFAIIGLALTIELAIIYYNANYVQYGLSSFCSINNFIDCDGAAKSNTAQFLGIPLAYWGIFFYLIILFLSFVGTLSSSVGSSITSPQEFSFAFCFRRSTFSASTMLSLLFRIRNNSYSCNYKFLYC